MKRTQALRWNRLRERAASLGVTVQTLIRLDAAAQRESGDSYMANDAERMMERRRSELPRPASSWHSRL
jgi:hypothetical protein